MPIKLLIYEDNENLCNSLKTLFEWNSDFELLAALPNAQTVLTDIEQLNPDVILSDIDMPGITGTEALVQIRKHYPELPVIMLTVFDDNENIFNAICNGASGYLLKNNLDQLVPAIKDVLNGGAPMTSAVAKKVLKLFAGQRNNAPVIAGKEESTLTNKENDILQLLVKGYSYKMIAAEMTIALETVRTHIKRIYKKLQVNSATEAIYKTLSR
ncbi:MAG: response regulator transcription factor [Ferruginibacter sp.]